MNKIAYNNCYGIFSLSIKAINWIRENYPEFNDFEFKERHNPVLIKCIETLGPEVNGVVSNIEIKTIDGRVYRIDEYDGLETVVEPNDEEWIIINKK